jgi:uncharacterized protein
MNPVKSVLNLINHVAQLLVLIGALNWGLIGAMRTDAVILIFPKHLVRTVHIAVGVAALYLIVQRFL